MTVFSVREVKKWSTNVGIYFSYHVYILSGIDKTEPKNDSTIKDRGRGMLSTSRQHQFPARDLAHLELLI